MNDLTLAILKEVKLNKTDVMILKGMFNIPRHKASLCLEKLRNTRCIVRFDGLNQITVHGERRLIEENNKRKLLH